MKEIRPIHPFGPAVGEFTFEGTTPQSIQRQRERSAKERRRVADAMQQTIRRIREGERNADQ